MTTLTPTNLPRLLFVVPDAVFMPCTQLRGKGFVGIQTGSDYEFLTYLISDLYHAGVDVHMVQPDLRRVMAAGAAHPCGGVCADLPASRVHLARDRVFYYANEPVANPDWLNLRIAIAFQREVLYRWIPEIEPDLVQCHDWMCGLIPAAVGTLNLPCILSLGRMQSQCVPLWLAEDMGLDVEQFWDRLYYRYMPGDYAQTRQANCADLLLSGINAATMINTVSTGFLQELISSHSGDATPQLRQLLRAKISTQRMICIHANEFGTDNYIALYEKTLNRALSSGEDDGAIMIGRDLAFV